MDDLFSGIDAFPIERGIEITNDRQEVQRTKWDVTLFPFASMDVGESFKVAPPPGEPLIYTQNAVSGAASTFSKRRAAEYPAIQPPKFTTRQQKGGFVRCWRIA